MDDYEFRNAGLKTVVRSSICLDTLAALSLIDARTGPASF
jgi:hypothetical protein